VTVPEQLRAYAGLEKDVVVIGVADMIEIWDQESWDDFSKSADEYYASIKEGFTEERA
jgi:MraZ protein